MSVLIDFSNTAERLGDFGSAKFRQRYQDSPSMLGIAYTLVCLQWEGTPEILSDAFTPQENDIDSFASTLTRLDYECQRRQLKDLTQLSNISVPAFIEFDTVSAIFLGIENHIAKLYDYRNNVVIEHAITDAAIANVSCDVCEISEYSKIFREPPPESQDKSNWIKHAFYRYTNEIKSLMILSLIINLLGAMQPFFIMGVYSFALSSGSEATLFWLTSFAIFLAAAEYGFKRLRMNILATSGKDLATHISKNVLSKLLWLPYAMTSSAGVSSQLARLKDIDQLRKLVTAESSLSYFDMPFVIIFILAITIISGSAALTVLAGIGLMLAFCVYSRYIYSQVTAKSSRANAMVSYQWNELLRNINTIQGLPLLRVIRSRFHAAHNQNLEDTKGVSVTNGKIQSMGQGLIQAIGTASIVTAVMGVMAGETQAGAMLAIIILVWKALGPIMGIYNSITKFKTIKSASAQINALMSLNDDRNALESSPPIRQFNGNVVISGLTHRYQGTPTGLTNLAFNTKAGDKVSISGVSGSGKTTLLTILAGLEERYQGNVLLDGYNIKQFNNFRYRKAINYIPFDLHIFEGTLASNFIIHDGLIARDQMEEMVNFFDLSPWLPQGLETQMSSDYVASLPNGVQQRLRIALGLGSNDQGVIIMDEPFVGCEKECVKYINQLFTEKLAAATVIFTTNDKSFIAASNNCLLLDKDGAQKYFGFPDKVIQTLSN
ncbi:ABC transporter permease [Photobacterium jeanii]|uniref:ABC transporter permease n=1 Tax=Photobacterium jeanii TaxID=858640 RepID=A0A178KLQ6_9GAMM|nr:ATP-binding cassette domain-containing protein [Photobacterium jeanii]OAN18066.1 ABC transporter permease [Photobacterium jeanii]PST92262.1 ABC transporter permease [Photobacterium jeanii]